jgi:predicted DNA-binding protein
LEPEQLERLKALSEKTGAPMTHYMREGIDLVLEKYSSSGKAKKRKT